jgi:hypothetical protein
MVPPAQLSPVCIVNERAPSVEGVTRQSTLLAHSFPRFDISAAHKAGRFSDAALRRLMTSASATAVAETKLESGHVSALLVAPSGTAPSEVSLHILAIVEAYGAEPTQLEALRRAVLKAFVADTSQWVQSCAVAKVPVKHFGTLIGRQGRGIKWLASTLHHRFEFDKQHAVVRAWACPGTALIPDVVLQQTLRFLSDEDHFKCELCIGNVGQLLGKKAKNIKTIADAKKLILDIRVTNVGSAQKLDIHGRFSAAALGKELPSKWASAAAYGKLLSAMKVLRESAKTMPGKLRAELKHMAASAVQKHREYIQANRGANRLAVVSNPAADEQEQRTEDFDQKHSQQSKDKVARTRFRAGGRRLIVEIPLISGFDHVQSVHVRVGPQRVVAKVGTGDRAFFSLSDDTVPVEVVFDVWHDLKLERVRAVVNIRDLVTKQWHSLCLPCVQHSGFVEVDLFKDPLVPVSARTRRSRKHKAWAQSRLRGGRRKAGEAWGGHSYGDLPTAGTYEDLDEVGAEADAEVRSPE